MRHPSEATPSDERLAHLLLVERRIEARVREAEQAAEAEIAAAREAAGRDGRVRAADLDAAAGAEEEADLRGHAALLRQITEESAARVARMSGIPEAVVDRLALRAVDVVLAREEGRGS